jgi:simple sugar transport system permease protein
MSGAGFDLGFLLLALLGGALKASTPFLLVGLGECLTERSGRVNVGLEGTLMLGAMASYGVAYWSGNPWLGVLAAGAIGLALGALHGALCGLDKVSHIAIGVALMLFGTGLAFMLGKPLIEPLAPRLPAIPLGFWSSDNMVRSSLAVDPLLLLGIALAFLMALFFKRSRLGLLVRAAGDSEKAVEALGHSVNRVRLGATAIGGLIAGLAGASLSLFYPSGWAESLAKGQGLMAIALVIFARWNPIGCIWAALIFGASGALGPSLQASGYSQGYQIFNAAPYVLTLAILIARSSAQRMLAGSPLELAVLR